MQIINEMIIHKVALIIPGQGIDTSNDNPAAKLQLSILGAVAEFEREVIRDRVNAGLAKAKQKGVNSEGAGLLQDITAKLCDSPQKA